MWAEINMCGRVRSSSMLPCMSYRWRYLESEVPISVAILKESFRVDLDPNCIKIGEFGIKSFKVPPGKGMLLSPVRSTTVPVHDVHETRKILMVQGRCVGNPR